VVDDWCGTDCYWGNVRTSYRLSRGAKPADYDDGTKYAEDQFSHEKLGTTLGALANMLQAIGLGLIGYALLREASEGEAHHTAVRVTAVITGVLVIANVAAANITVF